MLRARSADPPTGPAAKPVSSISSFIKKIAARLDDVARSVENHDGLAESAVRAARDRLDRAAHALEAARGESTRIDASLAKLAEDEHAARERARTEPTELAALEALRRARRLRSMATELQRQRHAYIETTRRLEAEASRIEDQLVLLGRTRHLLRAREERAEALQAVVGGPGEGLRGAIERWEAHVASVETTGQAAFEASRICRDPSEDETELLAELDELRRNR